MACHGSVQTVQTVLTLQVVARMIANRHIGEPGAVGAAPALVHTYKGGTDMNNGIHVDALETA